MKLLLRKKVVLFSLTIFSFTVANLSCNMGTEAIDDLDKSTFFHQLNQVESLSIKLTTDIGSLITNKEFEENRYQPATLSIIENGNLTTSLDIEVRPRGVTRRRLCDFPPIMLKAPKKLRESMNWRNTDNIKLVSYCKDEEGFQDLVYKEYLCYQLFNVLTDFAYTVKLANVTYEDSKGIHATMERTGFIIEPTDEMATRLGCSLIEEGVAVKTVHRDHYKNFVVFQYMIGNTDWNRGRRHNIRLIKCDKDKGPLPIPYDFDYSGLVNAEYAKPHPILPIKSVKERLFQWGGSVDEDFSETYNLFNEKKSSFFAVWNEFDLLRDEVKTEISEYVEMFYTNIASESTMNDEMMKARKK